MWQKKNKKKKKKKKKKEEDDEEETRNQVLIPGRNYRTGRTVEWWGLLEYNNHPPGTVHFWEAWLTVVFNL